MGVHGLTTFVESQRDKYKQKVYLRSVPVIIDGCNLMYFLYFDGNKSIVDRGQKKKSDNPDKVPLAHLFAGDWVQYGQNVRCFFQQCAQCDLYPIVIMDGAYEKSKLEVARTRFASNAKDNTRKKDGAVEFPGKTYTPVFLKVLIVTHLKL